MEKRAIGKRLRRNLAEPMVECRKSSCECRYNRHLFGGIATHYLLVLVVGGLSAHLGGKRADVVGDETVHCRARVGAGRRIIRSAHLFQRNAPVGGWID